MRARTGQDNEPKQGDNELPHGGISFRRKDATQSLRSEVPFRSILRKSTELPIRSAGPHAVAVKRRVIAPVSLAALLVLAPLWPRLASATTPVVGVTATPGAISPNGDGVQ